MKVRIGFYLLFMFCLSSSTFADRRYYVWTYQYATMPKGITEIEFYQTTKYKDIDIWEYRIEIEQGLSDRWDFSVYQIFKQAEHGFFSWDAVQFRTRYRFGEEGQFFVDPLLYIEYNRKINSQRQNKLEVKMILARTVSRFNFALNPVYELFFAPDNDHELGLDAGISWKFSPVISFGLETTSRIEFEDDKTVVGSYWGPTVSFASGRLWYAIGGGFGITEKSDDVRTRFLMGIVL